MPEFKSDIRDPQYERYFKNIRDRILFKLGYPVIRVELVAEQLNTCILEAVKKYYEYAALEYGFRVVPSGNGFAEIPEDIHPKRIVDVIFELDGDVFSFGSFGDMAQVGWAYQLPSYNDFIQDFEISKYYLYVQQIEDLKKVLAINRNWVISNGRIELFPKENDTSDIGILYGEVPTLKEVENEEWIHDYALAQAKQVLGEIREKLASSSGAGGNLALNGSQLKAEGKAMEDQLRESLMKRQRPLPIMQL